MKKINYINLLLFIFLLGCENEELVNPKILYDELLVVQCEINPNQIFPGVKLTKTLPVGNSFTIEKAEIKDATIYLKIDSVQIIPLHYTSEGMYKPLYDFTVKERQVYELFGESRAISFYAKSIIPNKPVVNSTSYNYVEHYAIANTKITKDEVYAALWAIGSGGIQTSDEFYNITNTLNNPAIINAEVRSASYPENYLTPTYNGLRYVQVCAFDISFEKYFKTFKQGGTINNPYVQGSGATSWNVIGDKVIGLFIGVARGDFIWVN